MSGPWDRPSQDREPLESDQDATPERPEAGTSSGETWPSSDLWSDQRPGAGSGWDDWSTIRAPDDFVLDEPVSTLGDPWSESWAAEEAAGREDASTLPAPDRWSEPQPDRWDAADEDRRTDAADRWEEPAEEPAARSPEPEPEPIAWSPAESAASEPADAGARPSERDSEPAVDPWGAAAPVGPASSTPEAVGSVDEPRVAPWRPSDDPWAEIVEPEEPAAEHGVVDEAGGDTVAIDDVAASSGEPTQPAGDVPEAEPAGEPEPAPTTGGWRRDLLPSWLTGRAADTAEPAPAPTPSEDESSELADTNAMPVAGTDVPPRADQGVEAAEEAAPVAPETDASAGEPAVEVDDRLTATSAWAARPAEDAFAAEIGLEPAPDAAPGPSWEDDAVDAVAPPGLPDAGTPSDTDAEVEAAADDEVEGTADIEAEAAAELEAAPPSMVAAWPEADVVGGPTPVDVPAPIDSVSDDADEGGDRRFDAWLGAPMGAAAAAAMPGAGPTAASDAEAEIADEVAGTFVADTDEADAVEPPDHLHDGPSAEPEPPHAVPFGATVEESRAPETWAAGAGEALDAEEAWVAEPEAWEPAAWPTEPAAEAGPDDDEAGLGAEPWAAAAAGAAAGMVGGTPSAAAEPEAAPAEPSTPAAPQEGVTTGEAAEPGEAIVPADSVGPQPTWRPDWLPDLDEVEAEEHTRVLPTDWSPPPAPATPVDQGELTPHATAARTRPASDAERDLDGDAEPDASTAEQAVPWLIGFILLLAGMVIVLLALIFAGDASLGGGSGGPTPRPSLAAGVAGSPSPSPVPSGSAAASPTPAAASASASPAASDGAVGGPAFGPIEMVYQGRAAPLAPIYLLHREFATEPEAEVLAQDPNLDLRRYAWAMDGTRGAGMYADLLVSIEPGVEKRQLADGVTTVTFGSTPDTVYAVRVTQEGADDVATVLAIDFASGGATELARLTYARPAPESRAALAQAQYEDDGGQVRLFWMEDNRLRLWVLNGGMWEIDPGDGSATEVPRRPPLLWSPDGRERIVVGDDGSTSVLTRVDMDGNERAAVTVDGLVSHVRWSPESDRIVFTLGRSTSGGGVLQDLYLWDLGDEAPTQITTTGAAFGAEWMGARVRWGEDPG